MRRNPWLSDADLAEIDLVAHALVGLAFNHRQHCQLCRETGHSCTRVLAAINAAVCWAERRALASKADALRQRHIDAALRPLERRSP